MSLDKPTIVIFDMDGTSVRHTNPRLLHVLEWLDDLSFKITRLLGWTTSWLFERSAKGPLVPKGASLKPPKQPRLLVHRAMHKIRRKPVEQIVEPSPGVYDVLNLLQAHNIPLALVSSGLGKGYGHDILSKFDLAPYFGVTIFREDIKKNKPNPEPLLLALERMGITPQPHDVIWYIGDRHKDVKAARAADAHIEGKFLPIAYGFNAAVAIIDQGYSPEQIIMSYWDMEQRLIKLLGTPPKKNGKPPHADKANKANKADKNVDDQTTGKESASSA